MKACLALVLALASAGCSDGASSDDLPARATGTALPWARRFGKSTMADPVAVATDGAGNAVVGGRFFATADFGGGPVTSPANNWQAFVAKYDAGGTLLWMRSLGGIFEEYVTHVAFDGDGNVYAAGTFVGTIDFGGGPLQSEQSDIFVAKLALDGSHLWSKRFGSAGIDALYGMAVHPQGDVVLTGHAGNGADFGAGPTMLEDQGFIAKLDASAAGIYVTGTEPLGLFEPGYLGAGYVGTVEIDAEGAIVVASSEYRYVDNGDKILLVTKLDPAGGLVWQREVAWSTTLWLHALSLGADGTLFLAGKVGEYFDFGGMTVSGVYGQGFVAATGPDGAPQWVRLFAAQNEDINTGQPLHAEVLVNDIDAAGSGVLLTGSFFGRIDFGGGVRQSAASGGASEYFSFMDDVFALQLDSGGAYQWDATFGNPSAQAGTSVSADPSGNVFVAGWANGPLPFGDGAFAGTAYYDGFLVKLTH